MEKAWGNIPIACNGSQDIREQGSLEGLFEWQGHRGKNKVAPSPTEEVRSKLSCPRQQVALGTRIRVQSGGGKGSDNVVL